MHVIYGLLKRIVLVFGALALAGFFMISLVFLGLVFLLTGRRSQVRVFRGGPQGFGPQGFKGPQDFADAFHREPPRDVTPAKPLELE